MPIPPTDAATPQRRVPLLVGASVLLAIAVAVGVASGLWDTFLDLMVYRLGAQTWLDGDDLYGDLPAIGDSTPLPFTYPPLAAIAFSPLAVLPSGVASAVMFGASLAALGLTLWLVLDRVLPRIDRWTRSAGVVVAVSFAIYLEPFRETLSYGQVNAILMAAIALDVLAREPKWPRGLLIGIAVSIKLTPAGFLLFFLIRRDWRAFGTTLLSAAGAVAVAWAIMPDESREYWFHALQKTSRIGAPYFAANQSLKGLAFRLGIGDTAATVCWLVLSAVAVGLAAIWMQRLLAEGAIVPALLVNAAAVLLVSPVSWTHHWVWVAPALLVALLALRAAEPARRLALGGVTAVAAAVFYIGPHWLLPSRDDLELDWSWWQQIVGSSYVLLTFGLLAVGAGATVLGARSTPRASL